MVCAVYRPLHISHGKAMQNLRSRLPTTSRSLTDVFSTCSGHRRSYSRRNGSTLPPLNDPSALQYLISSLPTRFTADDLTALLSRTDDPLLCLHLFQWSTSSPHHQRRRFLPSPFTYILLTKKLIASSPRLLLPFFHPIASSALSSHSHHLSNSLIRLYSRHRMLSRAVFVFRLMLSQPDPTCRPTLLTYNLLLSSLVAASDPQVAGLHVSNAYSLFRRMLASGIEPNALTLNSLVRGHVLSTDVDAALRLFHRMSPVHRCEPDGVTYGWLVHGLCAAGRTRDARLLVREMEEKGFQIGEKAGNSLVSAMALGGEVPEAVELMWTLVEKGKVVDGLTCGAVVGGLCREGKGGDAALVVGDLREKGIVGRRRAANLMTQIREEFGRSVVGRGRGG